MKTLLAAVLLACTLSLASCAGTASAVAAGPLLGGSSLTARVWGTESSTFVKVVTTPFSFAAGTVGGWVPSLVYGLRYDLENFPAMERSGDTSLADVWDAFGGFWPKAAMAEAGGSH